MAVIYPFRAIRAPRDKVGLVASRSYINYSKSDLTARLEGNPYTFLHVLNPWHSEKTKKPRSRRDRFAHIREKLEDFMRHDHLFKEDRAVFYIYRQDKNGNAYNGLIAGLSVDDYLNGTVKIHEHTLARRERIFGQYLDVTRFNAEPVLLTHTPLEKVNAVIAKYEARFPDYDFRTTDTVRHRLWVIDREKDIETVAGAYRSLDAIYLADGHHRSASSALLAIEERKKHRESAASKMFMSLFIPEDQLRILAFDRLVKGLNGKTPGDFIAALSHNFNVSRVEKGFRPGRLHSFGIYLSGKWYRADLKKEYRKFDSPVDELDVSILTRYVLEPLLDIRDQKHDRRIAFSGGHPDVAEIEKKVNKKEFDVGFSLHPVEISQLKAVSDAGQVMPPKSTWIEPKLRSGLTILDLNDK